MEEAAAQGLPLPPLGDEFVTLVLVRHGESIWNKDNRFTAWMDVPLSTVGLSDARRAADLCRRAGIRFDVAFTSVLHRAVKTCHTILEHIGQLWIPTHSDWRLNERHDGALTGLNKKIAVVHYGKANVTMWRRSYATAPPPLSHTHPGWPGHDPKYARLGVAEHDLPCTESLDDTLARTLPCWGEAVTPALRAGKNVLVVTHGNGPQVGEILLRSDLTADKFPTIPIDLAVAATQGQIGVMLQHALADVSGTGFQPATLALRCIQVEGSLLRI